MKIDVSEAEKTASILLSGATAFIINQLASLHQELEEYTQLFQEQAKENAELKEKIKSLEDANRVDPALSQK